MPYLLALAVVLVLFIPFDGVAQWIQSPTTEGKSVYSLLTNDSVFFAGTDSGVYRSFNHGAIWMPSNDGLPIGNKVASFLERGNKIFAGLRGGQTTKTIFASSDGGEIWYPLIGTSFSINTLGQSINSIFSVTQSNINCAQPGILRSQDDGITWQELRQDCSIGFALNQFGIFTTTAGFIYQSTNDGITWIHRNPKIPDYTETIIANYDYLFVGTIDSGMYKYSLNDSMFERKSMGLPDAIKVNTLIQNNTTLLAGMEQGGVFQTTNQGEQWTSFTDDFPDTLSVYSLSLNNDILVAGTNDGVWLRSLTDTLTIQSIMLEQGWNLISLPLQSLDITKKRLFSTIEPEAFQYSGKYLVAESLRVGNGYWMKAESSHSVSLIGEKNLVDIFSVRKGWNIIGSISKSVSVDSIETIPPNLLLSNIYSYSTVNGYTVTDSIISGKGYWMKVNDSGKIILR
ncbi:MAG: hypothetical protein HYZ34_13885 [Ignavibacteriae bacterium]|nr:hypothetical protein [Ignavibacteriota bacterium]